MQASDRKSSPEAGQTNNDVAPSDAGNTSRPALALGDVAFLEVKDLVPFGAFVDWGLPKELLVPFAEQTCELRLGERYVIGVIKDPQGRLAGTQRVTEMLSALPPFKVGDWVNGEAWRREPNIGVFVIIERRYVGLLPSEEPNALKRGDAARFRVSQVLPDGKLQLSMRRAAFEELADDAQRVLARLSRGDLSVSDRTDPEVIRAQFGLSKKAFKRAVGRLLKQSLVILDGQGCVILVRQPRKI